MRVCVRYLLVILFIDVFGINGWRLHKVLWVLREWVIEARSLRNMFTIVVVVVGNLACCAMKRMLMLFMLQLNQIVLRVDQTTQSPAPIHPPTYLLTTLPVLVHTYGVCHVFHQVNTYLIFQIVIHFDYLT